jgi:hypothetical protein
MKCPRQESNLRTWFRKPLLYPLSYGGADPFIDRTSSLHNRRSIH